MFHLLKNVTLPRVISVVFSGQVKVHLIKQYLFIYRTLLNYNVLACGINVFINKTLIERQNCCHVKQGMNCGAPESCLLNVNIGYNASEDGNRHLEIKLLFL